MDTLVRRERVVLPPRCASERGCNDETSVCTKSARSVIALCTCRWVQASSHAGPAPLSLSRSASFSFSRAYVSQSPTRARGVLGVCCGASALSLGGSHFVTFRSHFLAENIPVPPNGPSRRADLLRGSRLRIVALGASQQQTGNGKMPTCGGCGVAD